MAHIPSSLPAMGDPGETKSVTLTGSYQRLADIFMGSTSESITELGRVAVAVTLSAQDYAAEIAFKPGTVQPAYDGHLLGANETMRFVGTAWVKNMWVRNETAASSSKLVVTPEY